MSSNMIIHDVAQGSKEWLELREKFHTASEANSMMGTNPIFSRTNLLDQKKGKTKETTYFQEQLFIKGHKVEELARPMAEDIIGDELYPSVATRDNLLASFDGATLLYDILFEHKQWNKELAKQVELGIVPESHLYQLEQQLYVSGAEKILFMVSNGTPDQMVWCWYESQPEKRKMLLKGWENFEKDLLNHDTTDSDKAVGNAPDQLMELSIKVQGSVLASNLSAFKENALSVISSIKTELHTDQDFADAEKSVKWCKDVENKLTEAKENILSQAKDINAVIDILNEISENTRKKRLDVEKLVKARKEEIKYKLLSDTHNELQAYIRQKPYQTNVPYDLQLVIKGKKTINSIKDSLSAEVTRVTTLVDNQIENIQANIEYIESNSIGYEFLFNDKVNMAYMDSLQIAETVTKRIADYQHKLEMDAQAKAARDKAKAEEEAARLIKQAQDQKAAQQQAVAVQDIEPLGLTDFSTSEPAQAPVNQVAPELTTMSEINSFLGFTVTGRFLQSIGIVPAHNGAFAKNQLKDIANAIINHLSTISK